MIPDKRKDKRGWRDLSEEERQKRLSRPPLTELQKLAQKENFALFTIKSISSQLHSLRSVQGIGQSYINMIRDSCQCMENNIKHRQQLRKNKRNADKEIK